MENDDIKLHRSSDVVSGENEAHSGFIKDLWNHKEQVLGTVVAAGAITYMALRGRVSSILEVGGLFSKGAAGAAEDTGVAFSKSSGKELNFTTFDRTPEQMPYIDITRLDWGGPPPSGEFTKEQLSALKSAVDVIQRWRQ